VPAEAAPGFCSAWRTLALSSTTSTDSVVAAGAAGGTWPAASSGQTNRNSEPRPGSLLTLMLPPIMAASWRQIASPSPAPPNLRLVLLSACEKASKMPACWSGAMPMPVSRTLPPAGPAPGGQPATRADSTTRRAR
jgi:hypothetical protein